MSPRKAVRLKQSARDNRIARLIDRIRRSQARAEARATQRQRREARAARHRRTTDPVGARTDRTIEEIKEILRQAKKQSAGNRAESARTFNAWTDARARLDQGMAKLAAAMKDLAATRKVTDKKFQAFLDGLHQRQEGQ